MRNFYNPGRLLGIAGENDDTGLTFGQGSIVGIEFGSRPRYRYLSVTDYLAQVGNKFIV